jgi:ketosteroid isomerase-like protein
VWPLCSATAKASLERTVRELLAARELSFDEGGAYYTRDTRARIWDDVAVVSPGHEHYQEQARPWADASQRVRCDLVDLQVLAAGGLGVTVLIMRNREEAGDGYVLDSFLRRTLVWARSEVGWRVVHEHTSPLPLMLRTAEIDEMYPDLCPVFDLLEHSATPRRRGSASGRESAPTP